MTSKDDLKRLIASKERRLQKLKDKKAIQGISTDPSIDIEMEDIEKEIQELKKQLRESENNSDVSGEQGASETERPKQHGVTDHRLDNAQVRLESKFLELVNGLRGYKDTPIFLVGGVYLDIIATPVITKVLEPVEWTNLRKVEVKLGGSDYLAGKYLREMKHPERPNIHLFIQQGSEEDPLTATFTKLITKDIEEESWLKNRYHFIQSRKVATTILLNVEISSPGSDDFDQYTTMFTYSAGLRGFGWDDIGDVLDNNLGDFGVLYLSGYFKSFLCNDLPGRLRELRRRSKLLVCIDHGSFVRRQKIPEAIKALIDSFKDNLIDIYFCTIDELWRLCYHNFEDEKPLQNLSNEKVVTEELEAIAGNLTLPLITFVRDTRIAGRVYVIIKGKVPPVFGIGSDDIPGIRPARSKSAFNAGVIHYLLDDRNRVAHNLEMLITKAGEYAIKQWNKAEQ